LFPLPPRRTLQTAFLSLSGKKQAGKCHFFRCPQKKNTPNGIIFVVPEKTTLQKPFLPVSRKKQGAKRLFYRSPGKNSAPKVFWNARPGKIPEKKLETRSFP